MTEQPRIPTLVAIIILLIGLVGAIVVIENTTKLFSRASVDSTPVNTTITNITDTSFSIGWTTNNSQTGMIKYKEQGILGTAKLIFDIRDQNQKVIPRQTHFFTVTGLKPNTDYSINILSGNQTQDNSLSVTTFSTLPAPSNAKVPAFGKIIDNSNNPASDVLVFLNFDKSQTLGTVTSSDGSFMLPTNILRTTDGKNYFVSKNTDVEKLVFLGSMGKSQVLTFTQFDAPIPTVRLGENYDFTKKSFRLIPVSIAAVVFNILQPLNDAAIPSGKPLFKGYGEPDKNVLIVLSGPQVISEITQIDTQGNWHFTPKNELLPGKYTATFTSSENGITVTKSISFIILKSGTQVLGDATPSATIKPSILPSPSLKPSPTATSSVIRATPRATPKISTKSAVPTTGNWTPTLVLLILGLGIFFSGLFGFRKNNKFI